MKHSLFLRLIPGMLLLLAYSHGNAKVENLYHYMERLPKSISERDYRRFSSATDIKLYVDSCMKNLISLNSHDKDCLDEWLKLNVELHDLTDQFPDLLPSDQYGQPSKYTVNMLKALERFHGVDSREYSEVFAEYLLYDSNDRATRHLAFNIAQDAFTPDSAYYENVRYKVNRFRGCMEAAVSFGFSYKNSLSRKPFSSPLHMEALWMRLLKESSGLPVTPFCDLIMARFYGAGPPENMGPSVPQMQRFMDGTGLLLSLYDDSLPESDKQALMELLPRCVQVVEKTLFKISGNAAVSKQANAVHTLAYLGGWRNFIANHPGKENELAVLDSLAMELFHHQPVKPRSYEEVYAKYFSLGQKTSEGEEKASQTVSEELFEYLLTLNTKIKAGNAFSKIDSLMPPIIQWRFKELQEQKEYLSALEYAALCLSYVEQHFDNSFTWYVDYTSEETIASSLSRREEWLEQGWTGTTMDQYVSSYNLLEHAVDYMIATSDYVNHASPTLLYEAAKKNIGLGDYDKAFLYANMGDELFNLLGIYNLQFADNKRILALANELANDDDSTYSQVEKLVPVIEELLLSQADSIDYTATETCLIDTYCALCSHERRRGNFQEARFWIEQALDNMFRRENSKWALEGNGGFIRPAGQRMDIPVLYNQWQNALACGDEREAASAFVGLHRAICDYKITGSGSFEFYGPIFEVDAKYLSERDNRNDEEALELVVRASEEVRTILGRYSAIMHPRTRNEYFESAQKALSIYNGVLANVPSCESTEVIFNNILATRGIQLLSEKLLVQALLVDEQCKDLNRKLGAIDGVDNEGLIAFFRTDLYKKKLEERALTSQGLEELISLSYEDIQSHLENQEVVIEFFRVPFWKDRFAEDNEPARDGLCAALLKQTGKPQIIPLCPLNELPKADFKDGYFPEELSLIYRLIWEPMLPYLEGVKTVFFVPDADLHNFPIEYLRVADGPYIFDEFKLFRLSSSREILSRPDKAQLADIALFGHMHYDSKCAPPESDDNDENSYWKQKSDSEQPDLTRGLRGTHEDLPHTKEEIQGIRRIARANGIASRIFSGQEATEEAFKSLSGQAPSIVHLATHGNYWPYNAIFEDKELMRASFFRNVYGECDFEDPLCRSVLMFTGANKALRGEPMEAGEDGVLTAREISTLDFSNMNLLVLSACQSALGDIAEDGVFGLQRGVKKAGGRSILMSLWEVDDVATQKLMTSFYEYLLSGDSKSEALKKAQKDLRESSEYEAIDYWGAFILLDGLN